ncbi:tyrosine-type recombinase/integrase [Kribbella sp. NPDC050470]|uniref:tyrosine-type recombinase/integrase n=1 Tax=unclassified Kribbella TaxID=2644121 RepID=UPI0037AB479E
MAKRRFGRVRKLPSGRFQARYPGPDGIDRPAPNTFASKTDAARWLTLKEAELARDEWIDPAAGEVPLGEYAQKWIRERPGLRSKTLVLYGGLLRNHIAPTLGAKPLTELTAPMLRGWRHSLLDGGLGPVTAAKAYRLLRSILSTAVEDRLIKTNPCYIKGAAVERSPERPVLTVAEVYKLANAMHPRFRALILVAALGSLRWGELAALQRRHVDLVSGVVRIRQAAVELPTGELQISPPKTAAGRRTVYLPEIVMQDLRVHFDIYVKRTPEAFVFTGAKGAQLRRSTFQRNWRKGLKGAGLTGRVHFHDLRHTGNTWAAESGATLRELMDRMGHASSRAALIYLHTSDRRHQGVAQAMSELVAEGLRDDPDDGLAVASGT